LGYFSEVYFGAQSHKP